MMLMWKMFGKKEEKEQKKHESLEDGRGMDEPREEDLHTSNMSVLTLIVGSGRTTDVRLGSWGLRGCLEGFRPPGLEQRVKHVVTRVKGEEGILFADDGRRN
jgi:hypothetical protein